MERVNVLHIEFDTLIYNFEMNNNRIHEYIHYTN